MKPSGSDGGQPSEARAAANTRSGSTTFGWKRVKIARPPEASASPSAARSNESPRGNRWKRLPKRNPRQPLGVTLKLRGGAECWVEVHSRGDFHRYPGWTQIIDIVNDVNGL